MYTKEKRYTLEELIKIFIDERRELHKDFIETMYKVGISRESIDYMFSKWIEAAELCKTEEEFDSLIRESLRMSFDDWFGGLK
jgi:hypothetical protein